MTKTKTERSAKIVHDEDHGVVYLTITEVKGVRQPKTVRTHYRVEKNLNARKAYRLHKLVHSDEEATVYDVLLGRNPTCDCNGFEAHRHCKHVEALDALDEAGKLDF